MTENKRIVWNAVATYGRSVYSMLCGLFTSRWVLMSLGVVDYGLVGVVAGLTMFISFLNGLMGESIVRFYAYAVGAAKVAKDPDAGLEECRKWFSIAVAIHTFLPLILVAIGYPCGVWAVEHFLTIPPERVSACIWVWRCVCLGCFVSMVSVPYNAMYTAKQEIAELTIYSFVGTTVYAIGVYAMLYTSFDNLIYYSALTCAIAVVPQFIISLRAIIKYPECRFCLRYLASGSNIRQLIKYSGARFLGAISQLLTAQGIAIVVNKLLGPARNARYKDHAEKFAEKYAHLPNVRFHLTDSREELVANTQALYSCVTVMNEQFLPPTAYPKGYTLIPVHMRGFQDCDVVFDRIFGDDRGYLAHFDHFNEFKYFGEFTEVLAGRDPGRRSAEERLICYNIGLALHDTWFASRVYDMEVAHG